MEEGGGSPAGGSGVRRDSRKAGEKGGPAGDITRGPVWAGWRAPVWNEQWYFFIIQKFPNGFELIQLNNGLPMLEQSQMKYGIEGFEERNNFFHRNFFRFEVNFEWKIRETL
jgi:hypothetical protein